jgi:transposase
MIPEEIKKVVRPKSTVIKHIGNNFYVYHRTSILVNGRHIPKENGCVGKIINNKFVENNTSISKQPASFLDYGNVKFVVNSTKDLLAELKVIFDENDSNLILVLAIIRVLYDQVLSHAIEYYRDSYLHIIFKEMSLNEKTISEFLHQLGLHYGKIMEFTQNRSKKTNNHILIDGTLKSNESKTNTYSAFSRKARIKNYEDISLIYAYDVEKCEPIGAKIFPGNVLDKTSFIQTVKDFGIKKGLIIGDRGYISEENLIELDKMSVKYLLPLPSNSKKIPEYIYGKKLDDVFNSGEDVVSGLKVKLGAGKYLYAFKSEEIKTYENKIFMKKIADKIEGYTLEKYEESKKSFGLIVFYSNLNSDIQKIYSYYEER